MKKIANQKDFSEILIEIQNVRNRVLSNVNSEMVQLYFNIGKHISEKVKRADWGRGVVLQLADYIKREDAEIKGFTDKNLWRMKQFYETYGDNTKLASLWRQLSWSHNRIIMGRCKSEEEREFYLKICSSEKYTTRELERQINSGIFERTLIGDKKLSRRVKHLPQNVSNVFKDTYVFDFLNLATPHSEKELETELLHFFKNFILEIGRDFTFIGQQYRLQVGNTDFYIDLLFFHRGLQCLVAFELKVDKFKPEYMGQLEFYLEALDRDIKKDFENPSIGILLCREKDDEVVEYTLSRATSPAIIAEYETKLIPKDVLRNKINQFYSMIQEQENK
ncbi:MAG TPA: PDDEXK nuclease domain-containing protein [Ignavibacteriaceae bacterium]|nr:PDDEXK nuclease domain-containing protein [Ignavibacteriaceae bacterium]